MTGRPDTFARVVIGTARLAENVRWLVSMRDRPNSHLFGS